jgi:hypothetical protein
MENKTGKYFKYAIGEIILVVIGILIALQINNWNEHRQNRHKEATILKQIHRDFKSNKVQLDSIKISNQKSLNACNSLISLMPFKKEPASMDSINKYFPQIFTVKTFNPSNGSIEALISSSSFDVIQNDSLRNLLVAWKDVYTDYSEEEQYARDLQNWELMPFIRKNMAFANLYSDQNLNLIQTSEFQNMWFFKKGSIEDILNSIKDEQVEHYILEIIRLTKPNS